MTKRTNLLKSDKFKVGGYARSRSFGTRVYKVLAVEQHFNSGMWLTLVKVGETNRGRFRFTNSRPFQTKELNWYYPAVGI